MFKRTLTVSALLSVATAQLNFSPECNTAITTVATSANGCLQLTPLLPILTNTSTSIVGPVDTWLTGVCNSPSCSNDTLAGIVHNITVGCSTDLKAFGFSSSDEASVLAIVQRYYGPVRKLVCLKDGNTNCITQTLTNLQNAVGPLTVPNIINFTTSGFTQGAITPALICTNCTKAAYNIVQSEAPGFISPEGAQGTCGASFTDGQTPPNVAQSASDKVQSNSTTTQNSGALGFSALSGTPFLVLFGSIFTLLA